VTFAPGIELPALSATLPVRLAEARACPNAVEVAKPVRRVPITISNALIDARKNESFHRIMTLQSGGFASYLHDTENLRLRLPFDEDDLSACWFLLALEIFV
jgi:hypothetical protein